MKNNNKTTRPASFSINNDNPAAVSPFICAFIRDICPDIEKRIDESRKAANAAAISANIRAAIARDLDDVLTGRLLRRRARPNSPKWRVISRRRPAKLKKSPTMKNPLTETDENNNPRPVPFVVRLYTPRETMERAAERAEKAAAANAKKDAAAVARFAEKARTIRAALDEMRADDDARARYAFINAPTPADARAAILKDADDAAVASVRVYGDLFTDAGQVAACKMAARNVAKQWIKRGQYTPRQESIYNAARGAFRATIDNGSAGADFLEMVDAADRGAPKRADRLPRPDENDAAAVNAYGDAIADAEKGLYTAVNDYVRNAAAIVSDTRRRPDILTFGDVAANAENDDAAADIVAALAIYTPAETGTATDDDAAEKDAERGRAAGRAIAAAVAEMPPARRSVVEWLAAGASVAEIAAATHRTPATVCGHIADARGDIAAAVAAVLTPAERDAFASSSALAFIVAETDETQRGADIAAAEIAARDAIAAAGRANAAARAADAAAERAEKNARAARHSIAVWDENNTRRANAERDNAAAVAALEKARADYAAADIVPDAATMERADAAAVVQYALALSAGYSIAAAGVLGNAAGNAILTEKKRPAALALEDAERRAANAARVLDDAKKDGDARENAKRRARSLTDAAKRAKAAADAAKAAADDAAKQAAAAVAIWDEKRERAERGAEILATMDADARAVFVAAARGASLRDIRERAAANGKNAPSISTLSARLNRARAAFAAIIPDAATIAPRTIAAALNI